MKKLLSVILPILFLAACENTVDAPDWPAHDEKLVVTGFLRIEHDSLFAYARVNRTLPLGEKFDLQKAWVDDAELQVTNGSRSFPIPFAAGHYPSYYSAVTTRGNGDDFSLTVKRGAKIAMAEFRVKYTTTRFAEIEARPGTHEGFSTTDLHYVIPAPGSDTDVECIIETWDASYAGWIEISGFTLPGNANRSDGMVENTLSLFYWFDGQVEKPRLRYTLIARNRAYRDYTNSRWDWSGGDSPFDPPGKNPAFNVTGDGIGFFWYEIVGEPVEIQY